MTKMIILNKNLLAAIITLCCLTLSPTTAQDRNGQVTPAAPEVVPSEGSTYINKYFAFSLKMPGGWTAYGRDADKIFKGRIEDAYVSTDPATKAKISASIERTDNLLTLFKFPYGVVLNPTFAVAAEPLVKGVKTGKEVLQQIRLSRLYMKYRTEVAEDIHTERVGGADFAVMTQRIYANDLVGMQKFYITISKGYALAFVLVYVEERDLTTMMEVIKSIKFEHP